MLSAEGGGEVLLNINSIAIQSKQYPRLFRTYNDIIIIMLLLGGMKILLEAIHNIDLNILKNLHDLVQNPFFDKVMPYITYLGNSGLIWIVVSVIMICIKKYRKTGILCLSALLLTTLLGEGIIKHLVQRQRPYNHIDSLNLLISEPITYSFPSGHTASSFAAATVLSCRMPKLTPWVFSFAVLIAFSRLYLMVHYPTDVLAGALLGTLCALIVLKIHRKKYPDINS